TNPGRQADANLLQELRDWFVAHPAVRRPPFLGVLTHVDLLSPSLEWAPPYDWRQGGRAKEENIRRAILVAQEQLAENVVEIIPVCTAPGKVFGVTEELLPAMAGRLDEARGVAMLRCLNAEATDGQLRKIFKQLFAVGQEA